MNIVRQIRYAWKPLVFLVCLLPFILIVTDAANITGNLGANPIEAIQDRFGNWALRFILLTLAVTPARRLLQRNWLGQFRRMLGLYAFFYTLMHFLTWLLLDQGLDSAAIIEDIVERPFITIGFAAFLLLTVMAATSTSAIRRSLGSRWQQIHNSIYVVGMLGIWHFWWQVKKDFSEPLFYALILAALLGYRIWWRSRKKKVKAA